MTTTRKIQALLCVSLLVLPAVANAQFATTTSVKRTTNDDNENVKFKNSYFAAPQLLMVGDKPMNTAAGQMYPSPSVYDVDGDGQDELVLGDIWGTLDVFENVNDAGGDPVWSEFSPLENTDGDEIKVSNW